MPIGGHMDFRWKNVTWYVEEGDTVDVLIHDVWRKATVIALLSTQFTADLGCGRRTFRFFHDIGDSWRPREHTI